MSCRRLRSRSQSVERSGSVQDNKDEGSSTDFSQEGEIMTSENRDLGNPSQGSQNINPTCNESSGGISQAKLQEILNNVMQGIIAKQEESRKQVQKEFEKQAARQEEFRKQTAEESEKQIAKFTSAVENLRSEIREENEKLASSLTAKFEAAHDKIRVDFEAKLTAEIVTVASRIDTVQKDTAGEIVKVASTIDQVYADVTGKVETAVTQTKEGMTQYVDDKFKAVAGDVQKFRKIANEVSKMQVTLGELQNKVVSVGSNKPQSADAGDAIVRVVTTDHQVASTSGGVSASVLNNTTSASVSSTPAYQDSHSVVSQHSNSSVSSNVNVTPEEHARSVDLNELTLPLFTDSSKQVPLHFIRDLDLYFKLKQTPAHLKLPLTFRAVQEPIAKQWFSSTYEKLNSYDEFRKGFTDLLWNPNRQAGIRSQIYLDKHFQNSGESYVDHYIRYANLASSLDPPMTDMDLLSALTSHYEPRVQQGLLCGNFKCTQEVLGYLSKMQGLNENSYNFKAPRRDYHCGDANRKPQLGSQPENRPRERGENVNVRCVRRPNDRRNPVFANRRCRNSPESEFYGRRQGRVEGNNTGQLNPNAQRFDPHVGATRSSQNVNNRSNDSGAHALNN